METLTTISGHPIPEKVLGILYLCDYDFEKGLLTVTDEIGFENPFDALNDYTNTPNPASQLARGKTRKEFETELKYLHKQMKDLEWQKELSNYL